MNKQRVIALTAIMFILSGTFVAACPMSLFTPEEQARLLLQPTYSEIANLKADLVEGDITFEEWKMGMAAIKFRLEIQTTVLEAIRDSGKSFEDKIELLLAIFPWNVRSVVLKGGDSEVEIITYK